MARKKTALEKMDFPALPECKVAPESWAQRHGGHAMLIPTPRLIAEFLNQTHPGDVITIGQLRERLAQSANADFACPLTTGIFLRIVAEAQVEHPIEQWPWWRVVKEDYSLMEKLPGNGILQAERLASEGHAVVARGKRLVVKP
jgi:alkylated DNA nucleotide flippase Atl1